MSSTRTHLRFWAACLTVFVAFIPLINAAPDISGVVPDAVPITAAERAQGFRQGRIMARLKEAYRTPAAAEGRDEALQAAESAVGVMGHQRFNRIEGLRMLAVDAKEDIQTTIAKLKATGLYEFVEPDYLHRKAIAPNDTFYSQQWGLNNTGASSGVADADIDAPEGWDTRRDASGIIVAVIDSGIRTTHEDLSANLWTNPGETAGNGVDDDGNGYIDDVYGINATVTRGAAGSGNPQDDEGHGTHVAGIIGAVGDNSRGVAGTAWKVKLMSLKFLGADGNGSISNSIACINYAISKGAHIINASYGSNTFSTSEYAAIQSARAAGIIFVAAAGNDGLNNDRSAHYPSNYLLDNIVTVAATTRTDTLASYSDYGSGLVDLAAPGSEILSTYYSADNTYIYESGTSMATPFVAGAFALLKTQFPSETPRNLINRLLRSTDRLTALNGKTQTAGRLNLAKALTSSTNRPFNDDFADRATLAGSSVVVRSAVDSATRETGEPSHAGNAGGGSLWWTWTAPESGSVVISTSGSAVDTALGVYRGTSLSALTTVASNDDASTNDLTSRVSFDVVAGTTYQIAVGAKGAGVTGLTLLRIVLTPQNDAFAFATTVSGSAVKIDADISGASRETGEPVHANAGGYKSLWYKWTAPASRSYILTAFSPDFDTVVAIYTGSSLTGLTTVASNDDSYAGNNFDSITRFDAVAGTTYYFALSAAISTDAGAATVTLMDAAWAAPTTDTVTASPTVGADGTVYIGSNDGFLYAYNDSGVRRWRVSVNSSGIDLSSVAIGADGTLYVGDLGGNLTAYTPGTSSASQKWRFTSSGAITASPAVGSDGTVYIRSADTKLYALDGSSGAKKWEVVVGSDTYASPALSGDGATVYAGSAAGTIYAVNTSSGAVRWSYATGSAIYASPALASDGTIYVPALNGLVYALNADGTLKWSYDTKSSVTGSAAVGADGSVYVAAYDGNIHAISSAGSKIWVESTGVEFRASTPALSNDGILYVGGYDQNLHARSAYTGRAIRTWPTAGLIRSSPTLAAGRLYFASSDFRVYAIETGNEPAAGSWPMHRQNAAHTGRSGVTAPTLLSTTGATTAGTGQIVVLQTRATGAGGVTYQWFKDGVALTGATGRTLTLLGTRTDDAGRYTVTVTNAAGSVTSSGTQLTISGAGSSGNTGRLVNLSTMAFVSGGGNSVVGGLVLAGTGSRDVLLRAIGPTLATTFGQGDALPQPTLKAEGNTITTTTNTGWTTGGRTSAIETASSAAGAFALSTASADSVVLLNNVTTNGSVATITATVDSANAATGRVLLEVYVLGNTSPRLVNLATQATIRGDTETATAGIVVEGGTKTFLIRGVGAGLTTLGFSNDNVLRDARLSLIDSDQKQIASSDNWGTDRASDAYVLSRAMSMSGAFAIPLTSTDAAIVVTLAAGSYTVQLSGVNGASGRAIVEVYEVL